jgi:NADH:ubiquinone oxidoreductase subunit C
MSFKDIINKIENVVKVDIVNTEDYEKYPIIWVEPTTIIDVITTLKEELGFNWLSFISGVDKKNHIELVYLLYSTENKNRVCLKVKTKRERGTIPSIYEVFKGAAWHENEIYDLFGVSFINHPYPRRIFTTPDIKGYPLLKDFQHPKMISHKNTKKPIIKREKTDEN